MAAKPVEPALDRTPEEKAAHWKKMLHRAAIEARVYLDEKEMRQRFSSRAKSDASPSEPKRIPEAPGGDNIVAAWPNIRRT
jgi:hypothetical protein